MPAVAALVLTSGLMLAAQAPDHRDRVESGLVPVVITPADGGALEVKLLDNAVPVADIIGPEHGVPFSLAIQVDIGKHVAVETQVMQAVDRFVAGLTVSGPPIKIWAPRYVGQRRWGLGLPGVNLSRRGDSWEMASRPFRRQAEWTLASLGFRRARRVLILISDFADMSRGFPADDVDRGVSHDDLRQRVHRDHALLYVIGFEGSDVNRQTAELALETGGRVQMLKPGADPSELLSELAGELRRQSVLYFRPGVADGRAHTLTVDSRSSAGAFRARQRYIAFKDVPR